ncbi:CFEM domain protein [Rhizoctonia solani]|uniref:CFEM domain protein n=1 Tax=Rhizoctonia solani TaxID=456999 RepID=A0A8H8P7H6_9AGAM|nr:CFEM domain protein [Rhizoctonia solani]QRW25266.1 CFEM domain protein [Rhizoctonia solani]
MRFSTRFVVLGLFAAIASAQTPIPPTETAPTGSVTRTVSDTVTTSGTALPSSSVNGTITASGSLNSTATLSATSTTPTTTSYPSLVANSSGLDFPGKLLDYYDVNCYCNSTQFRSGLVQCVASNCPQDLSSAENYGQQFCTSSRQFNLPPAPSSTSREQ